MKRKTKLEPKPFTTMPELYKTIFDLTSEGIAIHNNGIIIEANKAFANIFGYRSVDELTGKSILNLHFHEKSQKQISQKLLKTEACYETEGIRVDGEPVSLECHSKQIHFKGENCRVVVVKDISDRKKIEKELKISKETYQAQFDNFLYPVLTFKFINNELVFVEGNKAYKRIEDDLYWGQKVDEIFAPDDSKEVKENIYYVFRNKTSKEFSTSLYETIFNEVRSYEAVAWYVPENAVSLAYRDVTEENNNKKLLIESEEKYKKLFFSAGDAALMFKDNIIVDCNQRAEKILKARREQIIGLSPWDISPKKQPDGSNSAEKALKMIESAQVGVSYEFEWQHVDFNNELLDIEVTLSFLDAEKNIFIATWRDITERKIAEEALKKSEATAKALLNAPTDAILLLDKRSVILAVNKTSIKIFNKSKAELIGQSVWNFIPEELVESRKLQVNKVILSGKPARFEDKHDETWFDNVLYPIFDDQKKVIAIAVIARNITDYKRAVKTLKVSEEKFSKIFYSSPDSITLTSIKTGHIADVNKGFEQVFGYTREEAIGKTTLILGIWSNLTDRDQMIAKLKEKEMIRDMELELYKKSGELITCLLSGELIEFQGELFLLGITKDITERKKAESLLIESEERNQMIIDNAPVVIWKTSSDGITDFISDNVEWVYGYTPTEIYSNGKKYWLDRIHSDDIQNVEEAFRRLFEENIPFDIEYRIKTKQGGWIWLHDFANTVQEENGIISAFGVFHDITEGKIAELALQESQAFNEILLNSSPDIVYIYDIFKKMNVYSNEGIIRVLGYTEKEIHDIGENILPILMHPDDYSHYVKEVIPMFIEAKDSIWIENEYRMKHKNGNWIWLLSKESIFKRQANGIPSEIIGVARDVSERKHHEEKIYKTMIDSEEKERERYAKELHDGLGPLLSTSMIYLHTMLDEEQPDKLKEYIDRTYGLLEEAVQSIREISNNLSPDILRKYGIVQAVRSFIEKLTLVSNIDFVINSNLEHRLSEIEEFTIYRTIIELLNNSLKYAKASKITISLRCQDKTLKFEYSDDGEGFEYEKVKKLYGGFGLINLENRIRKLGGHYEYYSAPGKGTNVIIKMQIKNT